MPSVVDKQIKSITKAWLEVEASKKRYVDAPAAEKNLKVAEMKRWKTFLSSLDQGLSGAAQDLQKTKEDKIPAACEAILKITKTYKTKLDNFTNTASANDTSLRSAEQLGIQLTGLDTNAKKLKLDPKNGALIANMVKYGKNWSATKKLETTAIETMWNDSIADSEKAAKLSKEAVDKCAKYVSSSVLEKFNLLDDSLDKVKLKVVAGKLSPLAQALLDAVGTLLSAVKGEAALAALRVCAFTLDEECRALSRKVEELKG